MSTCATWRRARPRSCRAPRARRARAGDADSRLSAISGDGRLVAFSSPATNLSAADIDPELDVFVRDTVANTTTLVSRASGAGGAAGDDSSFGAAISDDGRVVAFGSHATNLSAADPLGDADTYVRELRAQFPPPLGGARAAAAAAGKREPYPPARLWYRVSVEFKGSKVFTDRASGLPEPEVANWKLESRHAVRLTLLCANVKLVPAAVLGDGAHPRHESGA